jgi:DNA-binding NarL/FixJ family response regulator
MRFVIADDHAIVRKGLRQILIEEYPHALIEEADNAEELIRKVLSGDWHVVICDINMPGRSGLDALKQIKIINPKLPVLVMSMYSEDEYAMRVLKAGAAGFLGKDTIHHELINAIEKVTKGKKYVTASIAEKLAESLDPGATNAPHDLLSNREFDVFRLLASGKTNAEIAEQMCLGTSTISTYRGRILEKLQLRSNTDLVKYALERNLL